MRAGKRLGTNESVSLQRYSAGELNYNFDEYKTTTDDQGKFVLTFVPPGEQFLSRQISLGAGSWTGGSMASVTVKAGGITEMTMGGTGRAVVGKALFKDSPTNFAWKDVTLSLMDNSGFKSPGTARHPGFYYHSGTVTNGGFQFEDVQPGKYNLTAQLRRERSGIGLRMTMSPVGNKEIVVPKGGPDSVPVDVGAFDLHLPRPMNVGDEATDFAANTTDGKSIRLKDYRGKFVLLNFFYPQMANPDSIAKMKEIYGSYGKEKKFVMLGFSFMPGETLKSFAKDNQINWTLGTVGFPMQDIDLAGYFDGTVSWNNGVSFLIGPDGKLIAKGLAAEDVKSSLEKALASR